MCMCHIHRWTFLGGTPEGVSRYWDRLRRVRSFDTKSVSSSNIWTAVWPRNTKFHSPNFTGTFTPTLSTATSDMTSLSTSGRNLQDKTVENTASVGFGWYLSRTIMKFYTLIEENGPHRSAGMIPPAASGRLQNVIISCIKVRKTGPAVQRDE